MGPYVVAIGILPTLISLCAFPRRATLTAHISTRRITLASGDHAWTVIRVEDRDA